MNSTVDLILNAFINISCVGFGITVAVLLSRKRGLSGKLAKPVPVAGGRAAAMKRTVVFSRPMRPNVAAMIITVRARKKSPTPSAPSIRARTTCRAKPRPAATILSMNATEARGPPLSCGGPYFSKRKRPGFAALICLCAKPWFGRKVGSGWIAMPVLEVVPRFYRFARFCHSSADSITRTYRELDLNRNKSELKWHPVQCGAEDTLNHKVCEGRTILIYAFPVVPKEAI